MMICVALHGKHREFPRIKVLEFAANEACHLQQETRKKTRRVIQCLLLQGVWWCAAIVVAIISSGSLHPSISSGRSSPGQNRVGAQNHTRPRQKFLSICTFRVLAEASKSVQLRRSKITPPRRRIKKSVWENIGDLAE